MSNENSPNEQFQERDVDALIKSFGKIDPEKKAELLRSLEKERDNFKAIQKQKEQFKAQSRTQGREL